MTGPEAKPDDLDALLRDYGGLEGFARELGQLDPNERFYEEAANDNATKKI